MNDLTFALVELARLSWSSPKNKYFRDAASFLWNKTNDEEKEWSDSLFADRTAEELELFS